MKWSVDDNLLVKVDQQRRTRGGKTSVFAPLVFLARDLLMCLCQREQEQTRKEIHNVHDNGNETHEGNGDGGEGTEGGDQQHRPEGSGCVGVQGRAERVISDLR